jgi:hypothetical protein
MKLLTIIAWLAAYIPIPVSMIWAIRFCGNTIINGSVHPCICYVRVFAEAVVTTVPSQVNRGEMSIHYARRYWFTVRGTERLARQMDLTRAALKDRIGGSCLSTHLVAMHSSYGCRLCCVSPVHYRLLINSLNHAHTHTHTDICIYLKQSAFVIHGDNLQITI